MKIEVIGELRDTRTTDKAYSRSSVRLPGFNKHEAHDKIGESKEEPCRSKRMI